MDHEFAGFNSKDSLFSSIENVLVCEADICGYVRGNESVQNGVIPQKL